MSAVSKSTPPVPRADGLFNACELVISGFSGTGKTTLIERLMPILSEHLSVGYVKHDAHQFEMDRVGKDTTRIAAAGAAAVWINDASQFAQLTFRSAERVEQRMSMPDLDAVLIEGWKSSAERKLVMLDDDLRILEELEHPESILAVCGAGPRPEKLPESMRWFDRDHVEVIATFIQSHWQSLLSDVEVCGLVLTGGKSRRMKQDKGALSYGGVDQTHACFSLLSESVDTVFVSCRSDQAADADKADLPQLHDRLLDVGPMSGIVTALMSRPRTAWLVVACDLPFLKNETLRVLLERRNRYRHATAFLSSHDGFPEPLCAIYEPKSLYRMLQFVGLGYGCPRKMLINTRCELLKQDVPTWLDNVNTPTEHDDARRRLREDLV